MSVPQLSDHGDGVESGVLGKSGRDDFERLGVGGEAVRLHALERLRVLRKKARDVDLGRTSSSDERTVDGESVPAGPKRGRKHAPLLDETPHHAKRIVKTPLRLLQDQRVGSRAEHADRLAARVLDPANLDDLGSVLGNLLDEVRLSKLVGRHLLDVRDGLAAERAREELDLVPLDVAHGEDLELLEVGEGEFVGRVAEDRLLDEKDVAARLLDRLAEVEDVDALLLEDLVHLTVVGNDNLVVHLHRRIAVSSPPRTSNARADSRPVSGG